MNLTVITVNYNSSENTIKLLESLKNQTDKSFNVIVVDNNSTPEEKAILKIYRTEETNIVYIENEHNLGFSGGNNVGIKRALELWGPDPDASAGAGWVLLLNPDTWVENDFISRLKAELEGREGVVGLAIDEGNPDASVLGVGHRPLLGNSVGAGRTAYAGKIEWLKPTLSHVYDIVSHNYDLRCHYAIGGAGAIHKDVFDKIGFLDEKYFLYFEDADFSIRARKAGIPVGFAPEIKVSHSVSASTKKLGSPTVLRYHYRNALYFNLKHGPWYVKSVLWIWRVIIMTKQVVKIAIGKNKEESKAILRGVFDYYRRKYGKIH